MGGKKGCIILSIFFVDIYILLFLWNAITIRWLGYKKVREWKKRMSLCIRSSEILTAS